MVERTEIETNVRCLVAKDIIFRPLSSLGGKAERRRDKIAGDISDLIRHGYEPGERVFAKIEKRDDEKTITTIGHAWGSNCGNSHF